MTSGLLWRAGRVGGRGHGRRLGAARWAPSRGGDRRDLRVRGCLDGVGAPALLFAVLSRRDALRVLRSRVRLPVRLGRERPPRRLARLRGSHGLRDRPARCALLPLAPGRARRTLSARDGPRRPAPARNAFPALSRDAAAWT